MTWGIRVSRQRRKYAEMAGLIKQRGHYQNGAHFGPSGGAGEVDVVSAALREGAPGHLAFDVCDVHHLDGAGEGVSFRKGEVFLA